MICFIKIYLINIWLFEQFNFRGIVSSCFEPHLTVYVELEEKTLMDSLEKLVQVIPVLPFRYVLCDLLLVFSLSKSFIHCRRRHGILRMEVRVVFYPVACRWLSRSCYRLYVTVLYCLISYKTLIFLIGMNWSVAKG